jgi:hypothetical protein
MQTGKESSMFLRNVGKLYSNYNYFRTVCCLSRWVQYVCRVAPAEHKTGFERGLWCRYSRICGDSCSHSLLMTQQTRAESYFSTWIYTSVMNSLLHLSRLHTYMINTQIQSFALHTFLVTPRVSCCTS